jgi:hypothetical protein
MSEKIRAAIVGLGRIASLLEGDAKCRLFAQNRALSLAPMTGAHYFWLRKPCGRRNSESYE